MPEPRWLDQREAQVWQAYRDLKVELQAALDRQLERDANLSGADYALLVPLSESVDGVLRARDLGRMIDWERSMISHQVRWMEKRGLVAREDCVDDARGSMVRLTSAGRAAIVSGTSPVKSILISVVSGGRGSVSCSSVWVRLAASRSSWR